MIEIMSTYLKIFILLISAFLLRPSAMGQEFTNIALVLVVCAFAIHLLEILKNKENQFITRKNFIILTTSLLLWSYLLAHALVVGSNHMDFVVKATVAHMVVIVCATIILSHEKSNFLFFRWLIKFLIFLSFSYCVTFVIGMFIGIRFESLQLFNIPVEGYESSGNIYFPFTQLYGFMTVGNIQLPRALGFFREAGIFQAFLIWAYFNLKQYGLDNKKSKVLLFLGIIGTFSTAGIAVFFGVYAVKLFLTKRKFLSIALITLGVIGLLYAPYIGLKAKSVTHSTSISDRTFATFNGLERLKENPIGTGMYNAEMFNLANSGINLLAMSYMIGAIGLVLVLVAYFLPLYGYPFKRSYLVGIAPFFVTLLLSQPILDAPFIFIMLMANYGSAFSVEFAKKPLRVKNKRRWKFKRYRLTW